MGARKRLEIHRQIAEAQAREAFPQARIVVLFCGEDHLLVEVWQDHEAKLFAWHPSEEERANA